MSFRQLLESENLPEETVTLEDLTSMLSELNLSEDQLSDIAESILENYTYFEDELEWVEDDTDLLEDEVEMYDNLTAEEVAELDELDEGFEKQDKGKRMADRRKSKKNRKKATVKKDLKARSAKKCGDSQRVVKVSKGVYKCVSKDAKSKKRGKRMKKFKKIYKS